MNTGYLSQMSRWHVFSKRGIILLHHTSTTMKVIITFAFLLCSSIISFAQVNQAGTGNNSQSTGYILSGGNESLQNRPDSTHSGSDTTYRQQQWNNGATQTPKKSPAKTTKKKK